MKLSDLPSVDELLRDPVLAGAPHDLAVDSARAVLQRAREEIRAGHDPGSLAEDEVIRRAYLGSSRA